MPRPYLLSQDNFLCSAVIRHTLTEAFRSNAYLRKRRPFNRKWAYQISNHILWYPNVVLQPHNCASPPSSHECARPYRPLLADKLSTPGETQSTRVSIDALRGRGKTAGGEAARKRFQDMRTARDESMNVARKPLAGTPGAISLRNARSFVFFGFSFVGSFVGSFGRGERRSSRFPYTAKAQESSAHAGLKSRSSATYMDTV